MNRYSIQYRVSIYNFTIFLIMDFSRLLSSFKRLVIKLVIITYQHYSVSIMI
ncbi:hypothetical protein IWX80_002629 [Flavobacterium sp. CAN_S2]